MPISRILFLWLLKDLCHLTSTSITWCLMHPTPQLERVALKRWYTWAFNPPGLPNCAITNAIRVLLPHVFTLSATEVAVVIFCGTISVAFTQHPPVRWRGTLYCPDFPLQINLKRQSNIQLSVKLYVYFSVQTAKSALCISCWKRWMAEASSG